MGLAPQDWIVLNTGNLQENWEGSGGDGFHWPHGKVLLLKETSATIFQILGSCDITSDAVSRCSECKSLEDNTLLQL